MSPIKWDFRFQLSRYSSETTPDSYILGWDIAGEKTAFGGWDGYS